MSARTVSSFSRALICDPLSCNFVRKFLVLAVHLSVTPYHVTCLMISVPTGKLRVTLITLRELCGKIGDSTVGLLMSSPDVAVIIRFSIVIFFNIFSHR